MSTSVYEGDPKVYIDEDGAYLIFRNGQPLMDQGLENAALISQLTKKTNYWGNYLYDKSEEKLGSDFPVVVSDVITISSLNTIRDRAEKALAWMKKTKLAKNITARAFNQQSDRISVETTIQPPTDNLLVLQLHTNGFNWIQQRDNPAYRKE